MPKVSVLVAVYNAQQFLGRCLDSLLCQTLDDIQIVCIDDASTDDSLRMLNDYALRDMRIDVLRLQDNCGQAHARNVGLTVAKGEVICMVDADDWLSPDALECLYNAFDAETDCVLFDLMSVFGDRVEHYDLPPFSSLTGKEAFRLSLTWKIHGLYGVRANIHRRFPYDETCRLYSDDNTTRLHYLASRRVTLCSGIYYYRQHAASMTHKVSVRRFDYLRANESMRRQMLEAGVGQELLVEYENHRWLNLVGVYMFYHVHGSELSPKDRRYGLSELYRTWLSIDRPSLNKETTTKFGYRPCQSWRLFRLQEWLYFTLRGLLGRNR